VAECFKRYAEGKASLIDLSDYLRANGHTMTRQGVRYMLRNRAYVGLVRYGVRANSKLTPTSNEVFEVPGKHEAIVDEDLFDKVQERFGMNRHLTRAAVRTPHLLTGMLTCGACGASMRARKSAGRTHGQYICYGRAGDISGLTRCSAPSISERKLDAGVKEKVLNALSPFRMDEAREKARKRLGQESRQQGQDGDRQRKKLEKDKAKLEARLTQLEDKYLDGDISRERYIVRRDEIATELEQVQSEIASIPRAVKVDLTATFEMLDSIDPDNLDEQEWRELLQTFVKRVTWNNGVIEIEWKPQFETLLTSH
jgi:site-specific DNA recombinase